MGGTQPGLINFPQTLDHPWGCYFLFNWNRNSDWQNWHGEHVERNFGSLFGSDPQNDFYIFCCLLRKSKCKGEDFHGIRLVSQSYCSGCNRWAHLLFLCYCTDFILKMFSFFRNCISRLCYHEWKKRFDSGIG